MKQTAVEWLEEQTRKPEWHSLKRQDIFEQAKEMEKQQIVKAYKDGVTCLPFDDKDVGEQYYNETYKKP
jgi:hypothetical protein